MKANRLSVLVVMLTVVMGLAGAASAQDQGGQQRQRGQGQGRQRGGGDPAQMREQMLARLKERLGASDDEWKVLQPKVEKVMTAQRDSRGGGGFGGRGGAGGRRGGDQAGGQRQATDREQSAVAKASAELRAAIDDKGSSPEEINKKLAVLRDAREKTRAERMAAQKELRELLNARQEAILVSSGLLE